MNGAPSQITPLALPKAITSTEGIHSEISRVFPASAAPGLPSSLLTLDCTPITLPLEPLYISLSTSYQVILLPESASVNSDNPLGMFDTIVRGTRHTLDFATACGARKLLFTSSGAVYGKQPPDLGCIPESHACSLDPVDPLSAYGEGKRAAELLCSMVARQHGLEVKIARCFAFVGPWLPLGIHYAIGNFIGDALRGQPVHVRGDGTAWRSYLYAADLAIWLWKILFCGESLHPYNVGSSEALCIRDIAQMVASSVSPPLAVVVDKAPVPGNPAERYVPSTERARSELDLRPLVDLQSGILKTIAWHRARS